jgi:hypothetical protein
MNSSLETHEIRYEDMSTHTDRFDVYMYILYVYVMYMYICIYVYINTCTKHRLCVYVPAGAPAILILKHTQSLGPQKVVQMQPEQRCCEYVYVCHWFCEYVYVCQCEYVYVCQCEYVYVCQSLDLPNVVQMQLEQRCCEYVYVCICDYVYEYVYTARAHTT